MELHGSLTSNLEAALASARRLRGHRVHVDTLTYWRDLLSYARLERRHDDGPIDGPLETLIAQLQSEIAEHEQS
jgi:hypothetical protein